MLIGYTRVSKADGSQSLDLQRDAVQAEGADASTTTSRPASATTARDSTAAGARSGRAAIRPGRTAVNRSEYLRRRGIHFGRPGSARARCFAQATAPSRWHVPAAAGAPWTAQACGDAGQAGALALRRLLRAVLDPVACTDDMVADLPDRDSGALACRRFSAYGAHRLRHRARCHRRCVVDASRRRTLAAA